MKTTQRIWNEKQGWHAHQITSDTTEREAQLALVFGSRETLSDAERLAEIRTFCPQAHLLGCSTAGEIAGSQVYDQSLVLTAVHFHDTRIEMAQVTLTSMEESYASGQNLAQQLAAEDLRHVFVLSDGLHVNGSALAGGLTDVLPADVSLTGGLAGDAANFQQTFVLLDDQATEHSVAALGLYGTSLNVGYGSNGGWDSFGPDRLITKSQANILYELDSRPALELYKTYLGDQADGLPATGLLFPLSLAVEGTEDRLVRTILGVNEADGSMTFAGDMPEGSYARLMKANTERLVEGAAQSAHQTQHQGIEHPCLAILISCVGRKLVLKQRVEEELEATQSVLGEDTTLTGFYSYGELCPMGPDRKQAELHNQTMTITTLSETHE